VISIFFFLSGLLAGISFLGGYYLYSAPLAVICGVFAWISQNQIHEPIPTKIQKSNDTRKMSLKEKPIKGTIFHTPEDPKPSSSEPDDRNLRKKLTVEYEKELDDLLHDMLLLVFKTVPGVTSACLFFPSRKAGFMEMRAFVSVTESVDPQAQIGPGFGVAALLLKEDCDLVLEGDIAGAMQLGYYHTEESIKSVAGVPIMVKNRRNGALIVDSKNQAAFTGEHVSILKVAARTIGMISYRTYMDLEHLYQKQQMLSLMRYQRRFFQNMTVKDIYLHIESYVKEHLPFDRLLVLALKPGSQDEGLVVHCNGADEPYFMNQPFQLSDKGLLLLAFLKNLSITRSFRPDEVVVRIKPEEPVQKSFQSLMAVPVVTDSRSTMVEAVICVESKHLKRFTEHQLSLLQSIADLAGFALARARAFEDQRHKAARDSLTGLLNHRSFMDKLQKESVRAMRMGYPMAIVMIDIDHFKRINDVFGHPAGDIILKETAVLLSNQIRTHVDFAGRYGGEEFAICIMNPGLQDLAVLTERMRAAISQNLFEIGRPDPVKITLSLGVAVFPIHSKKVSEVLELADQALYTSKTQGRDRVTLVHLPPPAAETESA
jgi:diguanylate cyclase (GGDEF)-like protein